MYILSTDFMEETNCIRSKEQEDEEDEEDGDEEDKEVKKGKIIIVGYMFDSDHIVMSIYFYAFQMICKFRNQLSRSNKDQRGPHVCSTEQIKMCTTTLDTRSSLKGVLTPLQA